MTQPIQIVLLYENDREFKRHFQKLAKIEPKLRKALGRVGDWKPLPGFNSETTLGFATDTSHVTVERFDQPMDMKGFVDVMANPLNTSIKADLAKAVVNHKRAIMVQVNTGSVPGFGNILAEFGLAGDLGLGDDPKLGLGEEEGGFEQRLLVAQALGLALVKEMNPNVIHWAQSHQLFDGASFKALASDGFSLPLYTGPFLCDIASLPSGEVQAGIRAFGSQDILGKMVFFKSDVQDWADSYTQILGFIAYCRSIGRILEDHETMASDAPGAPVIRVKHKNDVPQLPNGYVELSVDRRPKQERPPVVETYEAEQSKVFAAMRGDVNEMKGRKSGTAARVKTTTPVASAKGGYLQKVVRKSLTRLGGLAIVAAMVGVFSQLPELLTLTEMAGVKHALIAADSAAGGVVTN